MENKPTEHPTELERLRAYVEELEATCDDCNWKYRTNEAEADLERLRRAEEQLSKVSPLMLGLKEGDKAPKTLTELAIMLDVKGQAKRYLEREKELERLLKRVAVLERVVRIAVPSLAIYSCPSHVRLKEFSVCPPRNDGGEGCQACWAAALAQAEGGE